MASRSDVASYIVLCALATLDRKELKSLVIDRAGISALLEHDTEAQQLLESFYACEYRRALSLLDKAKTRSLLNMTLAPHFTTLSRFITQRALRQFVQPFDTLQIARLAASLGWQGVEGEAHIIEELLLLIQKGDLDARVDVQNNVRLIPKGDCCSSQTDKCPFLYRSSTPKRSNCVMRSFKMPLKPANGRQ